LQQIGKGLHAGLGRAQEARSREWVERNQVEFAAQTLPSVSLDQGNQLLGMLL
jgi:hypothetical protein